VSVSNYSALAEIKADTILLISIVSGKISSESKMAYSTDIFLARIAGHYV